MCRAYLVSQIAPLEPGVSTDALVDGPCKFVIELPGLKSKEESSNGHEDRQSDEHGLDIFPEVTRDKGAVVEVVGRVFDLIELNAGIDENADVVDDDSDDLNGVFEAQGIPHEYQLVDVAEHEDGEKGGDGARLAGSCARGGKVYLCLEFTKDISRRVVSWMRQLA